jgi:hypothetical protein
MGRLLAARAALVHVYAGDELDLFSDRTVLLAFNGIGAGAGEPFVFPGNANPGEIFQALTATNVCETGKKPYDEVVTAALIVARQCFGPDILEIASDGTWDRDWAPGRRLAEEVLGRAASNPLSREGGGKAAAGASGGKPSGKPGRRGGPGLLAPSGDDRGPDALRWVRYGALVFFAALYAVDLAQRRRHTH